MVSRVVLGKIRGQSRPRTRCLDPDDLIGPNLVRLTGPSGKVDPRALPAVALGEQADRAYVVPQSEEGKRLARIWCEVLKGEGILRRKGDE